MLDCWSKMEEGRDNNVPDIYSEISRELDELRQLARSCDFSDEKIDECMIGVFGKRKRKPRERILSILKHCFSLIGVLLCTTALLYFVISCHNPTKKFISRHIQPLIYPFMRLLRIWTLPVMQVYDSSHWYQETCLVQNPFYKVAIAGCWACQNIRFVPDLSGLTNFTDFYYHSGTPFVVKDVMKEDVSFEKLQQMYSKDSKVFDRSTVLFKSNHPKVTSPSLFFDLHADSEEISDLTFHVEWAVYRVAAAQILRQIFKRPYFVPRDTEVSLQRFLYIDGPCSNSYSFPMTDFANVWLTQGSGERLILLEPSLECKQLCSSVSVILRPKDILFYNWLFWQPKSIPINASKHPSVTFLGSFY